MDRTGEFSTATVNIEDSEGAIRAGEAIPSQLIGCASPVACEDSDTEFQQAWGDASGHELLPEKVRKARAEEMGHIQKSNVYTKVRRSKAQQLGQKIIKVRWVDINTGDTENDN